MPGQPPGPTVKNNYTFLAFFFDFLCLYLNQLVATLASKSTFSAENSPFKGLSSAPLHGPIRYFDPEIRP
jgi:hypothetical protein